MPDLFSKKFGCLQHCDNQSARGPTQKTFVCDYLFPVALCREQEAASAAGMLRKFELSQSLAKSMAVNAITMYAPLIQWKTSNSIGVLLGGVAIVLAFAVAQAQTIILRGEQPEATQGDWPGRVSIEYVAPTNPDFKELHGFLRNRRALEKIQEIVSPFRFSEQLIIKTAECGAVNSYYQRLDFKPTVTICYEFLKHVLDSLPNATTPAGVTRDDATVGQCLWVTLHEVGHATFDIFAVPIFGREEDAADNFATFIMLQFRGEQARRLIGGAAWAWRAFLGDYRRNPVVQTRLAAFSSDHGLPQERFYNLLCLAFGANKVEFADAESFLPPTRTPSCSYEYRTLVRAFRKEIIPHIDQDMAKRVLSTNWLADPDTKSVPQR
ncbi:MAG: DUF4344 domain-containing metallopeptidase [Xanthobacteraceae bacterium]